MSGSVVLKLEVIDSAHLTCVLYREEQTIDVSSSSGAPGYFAIPLGGGGTATKLTNGNPLTHVFANSVEQKGDSNDDRTIDGTDSGCVFTPPGGANRQIRISVSQNGGGSFVTLVPDTKVTAVPTALVANTLQGKGPDGFIQVKTDASIALTQINAENIFSSTNLARLGQLLSPTAAIGFGNQRITNVADPSAATDAATKGYADTNLAGFDIDLNGVAPGAGNGKILTWDQTAGKWIASSINYDDATKLPLAGGDMSGAINMNSHNINSTGHITMGSSRFLTLGTRTGVEGALGLGASNTGATWFNRTDKFLKVWDGTAIVRQAFLDAGGKINGAWLPDTGVTAATLGSATKSAVFTVGADGRLTAASEITISGVAPAGDAGGDLTGSYPNPTIAPNKLTSAKLNTSSTFANGALVMSDPSPGVGFTFKTCANGEVLKFSTGTQQWECLSDLGITALTGDVSASGSGSVAVTLTNNSVTNAKISDVAVGKITSGAGQYFGYKPNNANCGPGELLNWDDTNERWICISPGNLVNINAAALQGTPVSTTAPASVGQVLMWNGTAWLPSLSRLKDSGSDSAPQLSFAGNTASGLYSSAAHHIGIATSGIARLHVTPTGNVGIGTTNPIAKLSINGSVVQEVAAKSGLAIDFTDSNMQMTSASCGAMSLTGMKSGGTYMLAVKGGGTSNCSFSSDGGITVKTGTATLGTTAGRHIVFTFVVFGTDAYVASSDNY